MTGTSADRPRLSVVIPTYRRRDSVARTLVALERQTLPAPEFEVVVAIDGSEDGTRELLAAFRPPYALQALWQPNRGRAAACNAGIRRARGEVIVILDDDMEPAPGFLRAHLAAHPAGSHRCALGAVPIAPEPDSGAHVAYLAAKFERHLHKLREPGHRYVIRDFYSGNVSLRIETLQQAGAFDERFAAYGNEDLELSLRLRRAGVELCFLPEACAVQHYDKDFGALALDTVAKGRTAVQFAAMHPEAYPELRLGSYHRGPVAWRLARAALLALGARQPRVLAAVVRLTNWLERRGVRRLTLYYELVLDYLYWLGAREASSDRLS